MASDVAIESSHNGNEIEQNGFEHDDDVNANAASNYDFEARKRTGWFPQDGGNAKEEFATGSPNNRRRKMQKSLLSGTWVGGRWKG